MSTTELAVIDHNQFAALVPGSDVGEALAANLMPGEGFDESMLVRVKTPSGGGTVWTIPDVSGEENTPTIRGILAGYARRGVLWPSEEPREGTMPVLVTHDLVRAKRVGDIPPEMADTLESCRLADGTYDWQKLPYTQFGSGKGGFGKRAKEQRIMFILRENDPFPLVVTAQPGSLKTVKPMVARFPVPHFQSIVELTLKKVVSRGGQPYSQIQIRLAGQLSKEAGQRVKSLYTDPLHAAAERMSVETGSDDGED